MRFDLRGTDQKKARLTGALARCNYPFALAANDVVVPVSFADTIRTHQAWGLFWLSGRIEVERSISDPEFLAEVLLSEVAHAVDQYTLTPADRLSLAAAWHPSGPDEHTWFDSGPYETWTGEGFMALFVAAFSDVRITMTLDHAPTPETVALLRAIAPRPDVPFLPPVDEPWFWGCKWSQAFHVDGAHWYQCSFARWPTREAAIAAGRRPCKRCKP